jgi:lipid-A-disaccharide synthase
MTRILIMAGEASGDQHGAALARALRARDPSVQLFGLGGQLMQGAGVTLLQGIERLDIVGLPSPSELAKALQTLRTLSGHLRATRYDAVVFIDNPGLNLKLAKVANRAGHRVVYYIAPQLWAWNYRRIRVIQKVVDHVLVILPFEEEIYRRAGVRCTFVGHPLIDELPEHFDVVGLRRELGSSEKTSIVGLLPGSRQREVRTLLPIMLEAARCLAQTANGNHRYLFVLGKARSVPPALIDELLARAPVPITVWDDRANDVMAVSQAMWVASGTATLQTALVGTPMTIVYRAGAITAFLVRRLIRVKWLGLANLVAGRTITRELLQDECTPANLAEEAIRLLNDPDVARASTAAASELRARLGRAGASLRAADAILAECRSPAAAPVT